MNRGLRENGNTGKYFSFKQMSDGALCLHCQRGYLVAEYSKSEDKTNFYCNNCFKYLEPEIDLVRGAAKSSGSWGDLSDEDIDKLLDDIFNSYEV